MRLTSPPRQKSGIQRGRDELTSRCRHSGDRYALLSSPLLRSSNGRLMTDAFLTHIRATLDDIEAQGLTKRERLLTGPQGGRIRVASPQGPREAVNLCSNNYLGLADHPDVIAAARRAMDQFGFGMASVRFICGAQTLHRELEQAIAKHLGKDDAIVFAACFDANGGVFEPLLGEEEAIISDSLNHASIIDGVRLSKAKRYRFANSDMDELEDRLKEADAAGARFKLIASDGVFSMDGYVAKLNEICASPTAMARWFWSTIATRPGIWARRVAACRR